MIHRNDTANTVKAICVLMHGINKLATEAMRPKIDAMPRMWLNVSELKKLNRVLISLEIKGKLTRRNVENTLNTKRRIILGCYVRKV